MPSVSGDSLRALQELLAYLPLLTRLCQMHHAEPLFVAHPLLAQIVSAGVSLTEVRFWDAGPTTHAVLSSMHARLRAVEVRGPPTPCPATSLFQPSAATLVKIDIRSIALDVRVQVLHVAFSGDVDLLDLGAYQHAFPHLRELRTTRALPLSTPQAGHTVRERNMLSGAREPRWTASRCPRPSSGCLGCPVRRGRCASTSTRAFRSSSCARCSRRCARGTCTCTLRTPRLRTGSCATLLRCLRGRCRGPASRRSRWRCGCPQGSRIAAGCVWCALCLVFAEDSSDADADAGCGRRRTQRLLKEHGARHLFCTEMLTVRFVGVAASAQPKVVLTALSRANWDTAAEDLWMTCTMVKRVMLRLEVEAQQTDGSTRRTVLYTGTALQRSSWGGVGVREPSGTVILTAVASTLSQPHRKAGLDACYKTLRVRRFA